MSLDRHNLLIVDDERPVRTIIRTALGDGDFLFREAANGEEALRMILEDAPDLVLCDYEMPLMNGFELLGKLYQDRRLRSVPVIILTGHSNLERALEGIEAGAQDYLVKPFDPEDLRIRVLAQIRRQDRNRAHTDLPSGLTIPEELDRRVEEKTPFAAAYVWLRDFDAYVYKFGYRWAATAIRTTSGLLESSFRKGGEEGVFVGHIAAENFLVVCPPEEVEELGREFLARFKQALPELYDEKDIKRGVVLAPDREGFPQRCPLLSPALCVVDSRRHHLTAGKDVGDLAAAARSRPAPSGESFLFC